VNNFVKENSTKSKKKFRQISGNSWHYSKVLDELDLLEVIL